MTLVVALLCLAAWTSRAWSRPDPAVGPKVLASLVKQTNQCRWQLGLEPIHPTPRRWRGDAWDRARIRIWRERRDAYCASARILTRGGAHLRALVHRTDSCLARIVDIETGGTWSVTIANSSSGAYGLPQALPGSKMASAGEDWRTNALTQLRWMRGYVAARYGSSCNALSAHYSKGWY